MRSTEKSREPMCETSERGEKLISRDEIVPISLDIGRRIMEIFGFQKIANIVFRLKSTSAEIHAVINGEALPSTVLLLGIKKTTGASIDWILTGQGPKFPISPQPIPEIKPSLPVLMLPGRREQSISLSR